LTEEQRQALEQWLRRVPDDPGGLLRRKFQYQHQQQRLERLRGTWETPAEERW
jgi:Ca-activated chloride channel family protein